MAKHNHTQGNFSADDGTRLYRQSWQPEGTARAVMVIAHGFGEHSGRYASLIHPLLDAGVAVHALDHRGHGESPGARGHIGHWRAFRHDLDAFVRLVAGEHDSKDGLFLYGHSMGGLMVLDYALDAPAPPLRGVIASAPFLYPEVIPAVQRGVGRLMSLIAPGFSQAAALDTRTLSRDPAVIKAYEADPLVHGTISARLAAQMFGTAKRTRAAGADFAYPLLIVHGEADRLVPARGSAMFFNGVKHPDRQRLTWPECRHEPHNDLDRDEVVTTIRDWILARSC